FAPQRGDGAAPGGGGVGADLPGGVPRGRWTGGGGGAARLHRRRPAHRLRMVQRRGELPPGARRRGGARRAAAAGPAPGRGRLGDGVDAPAGDVPLAAGGLQPDLGAPGGGLRAGAGPVADLRGGAAVALWRARRRRGGRGAGGLARGGRELGGGRVRRRRAQPAHHRAGVRPQRVRRLLRRPHRRPRHAPLPRGPPLPDGRAGVRQPLGGGGAGAGLPLPRARPGRRGALRRGRGPGAVGAGRRAPGRGLADRRVAAGGRRRPLRGERGDRPHRHRRAGAGHPVAPRRRDHRLLPGALGDGEPAGVRRARPGPGGGPGPGWRGDGAAVALWRGGWAVRRVARGAGVDRRPVALRAIQRAAVALGPAAGATHLRRPVGDDAAGPGTADAGAVAVRERGVRRHPLAHRALSRRRPDGAAAPLRRRGRAPEPLRHPQRPHRAGQPGGKPVRRLLALVACAAAAAACDGGCLGGYGSAPVQGNSGVFTVATVGTTQKLFLPMADALPNGNAWLAVVDPEVAGNGAAGAPAQRSAIDLGCPGSPSTVGADGTWAVAASTLDRNVWIIDAASEELITRVVLDDSFGVSGFSGGGGYVTGVAVDGAHRQAILAVW